MRKLRSKPRTTSPKKLVGGMRGKKVICAMSGGIDSSVAAALLKRAGFNVIGVFMKFWSEPAKNGLIGAWNRCCSPEAEKRARRVATILDIPFYVFKFEKEFKRRIVDYFLKEHKTGLTPNPCVVCNKEIKFGLLLEKALALGADFVATGHYARTFPDPLKLSKSAIADLLNLEKIKKGRIKLLRAKDKKKDQSYFLWQLNQRQLKHILFPVGNYTKTQVRNLAKKFKLPVLNVPESQEICFIPNANLSEFLKPRIKANKGKIVDTKGKIVGEHQGLHFYTIGQRKGIKLSGAPAFAKATAGKKASASKKASAGKPCYVLDKDFKNNILIITQNKKDLLKKELVAKKVNWISGKAPRLRQGFDGQAKLPLKVKAKIRYRHKPASAILTYHLKPNTYHLIFNRPQRAITPGQSVVFFRGQEILGGGIITL